MPGIYPLKGTVKHYDWGGYSFIPRLLGIQNPEKRPFAEYWMGIHPQSVSSIVTDGNSLPLTGRVETLPFLFKVLDVREMLSIQVHPTKEEAVKGYEEENRMGVPLDSPTRNYKDANHKPELMVALGDFWLLHGFKSTEDLIYTLLNVVELRELLPIFNEKGYEGLYRHVMDMPQDEVNRLLRPLVDNVLEVHNDEKQEGIDEDYWVGKAAKQYASGENIDRGIFSIYLFNLVHLKKGEGIFQGAGIPHAYLEGQNVEIMANSDNVLRGGLTSKHIDTVELLKHVKMEPTYPRILSGEKDEKGIHKYPVPVKDFVLSSCELQDISETIFAPAPRILLCPEGEAVILFQNKQVVLHEGSPSAFVEAGTEFTVKGQGLLFSAEGSL